MTHATITRPNLGSYAYIWIGNTEHTAATTSEAHALLNRRGTVTYTHRTGNTEHYIITPRNQQDTTP